MKKKQALIGLGILLLVALFVTFLVLNATRGPQNGSGVKSTATPTSSENTHDQQVQQAQEADATAGAGTIFVAKQVLVVFNAGTTKAQAEEALASTDTVVTKTVSESDMTSERPTVTLQVADTASVADAVSALKQSSYVKLAQPNYLYRTATS